MRIAVRALVSPALAAAVVLTTAASPGCVIISSSARPGPGEDAAIDGFRAERDSGTFDAGDVPVLSREEATRGLLASFGENLALPTYRALALELAALETATAAYAATGSDVDREAARQAWRSAMEVVQRAELLQIGPGGMEVDAEMTTGVVGGRGLRAAIYAWPVLNRCMIDVATERGTYAALDALAAEPSYARSLAAMEYLLFYNPTDHGCSSSAAVRVDDATWASLGEAGIRDRRADYAYAVAQLARRAGDELVLAWEPSGGDFAGQLARAGQSGSPYATTQEALNAVFEALFFIDTIAKDKKVGIPGGRNPLCVSADGLCPQQLESQWAGRAREHVLANFVMARDVFLGGPPGSDAIGFDDLLRSILLGQLAADMENALAGIIAALEALPAITPATLAANREAFSAAYTAIQAFTTPLKTDFAMMLGLELPMGADGDND